ncbi:hypothetical protein Cgig2_015207 [Carnegiea gigantea]|uniref:Transcription factor CBF/NF-Y/archaeal histone domain-containing protein n=1 Tax=Carnegiea gigantea TaxID=171969 RepID=A0A9Q1KQJ6_9CARY|nr:hypothetical protein Cgig2_015207 [Carnegiea gigantea]
MGDEADRLLPIANVGRIMKNTLPPAAKISKAAKETMQECVTEFISFVTGEASDKCHKENRKTVNGDDICWALSSLGFDNYAEVMARYLHKFRESERERAANAQGKGSSCSSEGRDEGITPLRVGDQVVETSSTALMPLEFRINTIQMQDSNGILLQFDFRVIPT